MLLCDLDAQITATIQTKNELEAEIIKIEVTQESILNKLSQIRRIVYHITFESIYWRICA